jgi:hypothetical protein
LTARRSAEREPHDACKTRSARTKAASSVAHGAALDGATEARWPASISTFGVASGVGVFHKVHHCSAECLVGVHATQPEQQP